MRYNLPCGFASNFQSTDIPQPITVTGIPIIGSPAYTRTDVIIAARQRIRYLHAGCIVRSPVCQGNGERNNVSCRSYCWGNSFCEFQVCTLLTLEFDEISLSSYDVKAVTLCESHFTLYVGSISCYFLELIAVWIERVQSGIVYAEENVAVGIHYCRTQHMLTY